MFYLDGVETFGHIVGKCIMTKKGIRLPIIKYFGAIYIDTIPFIYPGIEGVSAFLEQKCTSPTPGSVGAALPTAVQGPGITAEARRLTIQPATVKVLVDEGTTGGFILIFFGIYPGGNGEIAPAEIEGRAPVHRDVFIPIEMGCLEG
jgi:hypothetical protein